jgi:hypothetical protein
MFIFWHISSTTTCNACGWLIFVLAECYSVTKSGKGGNVCMHTAPITSIRTAVCFVSYQVCPHVPLYRQNTLSRSQWHCRCKWHHVKASKFLPRKPTSLLTWYTPNRKIFQRKLTDLKKKRHTVRRVIKHEPRFKSTEKSGLEIHTTKNEIQFTQWWVM